MSKWGKWTPSGKTLKCPNCGYRMQVPPNPADKQEQPKEPSQLEKLDGFMLFDKVGPKVILPASVQLRPVISPSEQRLVNTILGTVAITFPTMMISEAVAVIREWHWTIPVVLTGAAAYLSCKYLSRHYSVPELDSEQMQPAGAEQAEGDGNETELEPVGDIAGWMTTETTEGGAILRFYKPPIAASGRYIRVNLVQRMAIEIVNAKAWVSERDMARRGVANGPYRLIRQDWIDRRWIAALPDKTTVIEPAGRVMIGKIASTPPS